MVRKLALAALAGFAAMLSHAAAAQDGSVEPVPAIAAETAAPGGEAITRFSPRPDGRDHRLDFSVWTEALQSYVLAMGPPLRKTPPGGAGTPRRYGHNSLYRNEGAMVAFEVMIPEIIGNIARYRQELEAVADTLDIQALPRNEQLAFWINLHNVALVEKIAAAWPVYIPRDILVDGIPVDEARFVTVKGVALSPRDIRERIVFPHWKNPKVIYGFWRGEIGGPAMQREAFDGRNISQQLDRAAQEFANSRRGVERRGDTLHVSRFYAEAAPYYFPQFAPDLRTHLTRYAEGKVADMLTETDMVKASIYDHDIADLSGGRPPTLFYRGDRVSPPMLKLLSERAQKFEYMRRKGIPIYTVTFSNIDLPGDPPDKGEVE